MWKRSCSFNISHCDASWRAPEGAWQSHKAFTFLEILTTLSLLAILFLPMMRLFSHAVYSTIHSQDLITASNLAKWQMERIKNLAISKAEIKAAGNTIYPPEKAPPLTINNTSWRIKQIIKEGDPLEIQIHVFREGELDRPPLITLVTLIEDTIWEEIR